MIYDLLLAIHVMACVLMILVVLLQTGRGAGLSMFGGGGDSLITTPTGSNFMKNFTSVLAGTFAFTSLFLTLLQSRAGMTSVTSGARMPPPVGGPAVPGQPAPTENAPGNQPGHRVSPEPPTAPAAPKDAAPKKK